MHLNDIGLPQIIVSSNYDVSSRKIFSRWSVKLLDELPLFDTDDVFIGSHVLYTIIDWLMHNNARDEIIQFISFFLNVICCAFYRLCRSYRRSLSFKLYCLFIYFCCLCRLHCRSLLLFVLSFLSFLIVSLSFLSSFNSRSSSSGTDRLDNRS